MFWVGVAVAISVLITVYAVRAGVFTFAKRGWLTGHSPKLEKIWFVDGALAGRTDQLRAGPDGLPPRQFCALVTRSAREGGDYTMPYQRGLIGEPQHVWYYSEGWTTTDLAHADVESWPK